MSDLDYGPDPGLYLSGAQRRTCEGELTEFASVLEWIDATLAEPADVSRADLSFWSGGPGTAIYCSVDACGNALVVLPESEMRVDDDERCLEITYVPGWFVNGLTATGLLGFHGERSRCLIGHDSFGNPPVRFKVKVRELRKVPAGRLPYHYHYRPAQPTSVLDLPRQPTRDEQRRGVSPEREMAVVSWCSPRLSLTVGPNVWFSRKALTPRTAEILSNAHEPSGRSFRDATVLKSMFRRTGDPPVVVSNQDLLLDFRRVFDVDQVPTGFGRTPPPRAVYTTEDFFPPLTQRLRTDQELLGAAWGELIDTDFVDLEFPLNLGGDEAFDEDAWLEDLEALEDSLTDPPIDAPVTTVLDTPFSLDTIDPGFAIAMTEVDADEVYKRYETNRGVVLALHPRDGILQAGGMRKAPRNALAEMLGHIAHQIVDLYALLTTGGFAFPTEYQPALLDISVTDIGRPGRFEFAVVPFDKDDEDAERTEQTAPYSLYSLPEEPPFYRVGVRHTAGVTVGLRNGPDPIATTKAYEYLSLHTTVVSDDEFEKTSFDVWRSDSTQWGQRRALGMADLVKLTPWEDPQRQLVGAYWDTASLFLGFTPVAPFLDLIDIGNCLVWAASMDEKGQGLDLFTNPVTPATAGLLALSALPALTPGQVKLAATVVSATPLAGLMGWLGYQSLAPGGGAPAGSAAAHYEALRQKLTAGEGLF